MASHNKKSVFDVYPDEYDLITNAAAREKPHTKEIKALVKKFGPLRVLDAGCASGLTSLLFARQGIEVVGLDRSRSMLKVARQSRGQLSDKIAFRYGSFEKLPKSLYGQFDLVACLANSISGVTTVTALRQAMAGFKNVLRPGGTLVLQMLNYAALKEGEIMPIKATENNGLIYERFSERRANRLSIYVTRLDLSKKPPKYEIFRHEFDNFSVDQVLAVMKRTPFKNIRQYGNLLLTDRFKKSSRDLVITAQV